jgi:spoIIIJ-associated protein
MDDLALPAKTIASLLQSFISSGNLRLRFRVTVRSLKPKAGIAAKAQHVPADGRRDLAVEFSGPDTQLLTARNGELLNALEHIATKVLRLEPEDHDRVSFDAEGFKADRDRRLRESAVAAIERVRATGRTYSFPAMTSRERRMLHMVLAESGLRTASSGEGPGRFVVLYPDGAPIQDDDVRVPARRDPNRVRVAFRHR